jgi:hypothetical protein
MFNSQLLVGFMGRPSAVTQDEIAVLEQAFITSYESIECGDRTIDSVMIDTGTGPDYELGEEDSDNYRPFHVYSCRHVVSAKAVARMTGLFWRDQDSFRLPCPYRRGIPCLLQ